MWIVTAVVWLASLVFGVADGREWSWSYTVFPVAVVAALGLSSVMKPSFDDSRAEFEDVATELLSSSGRTYLSGVQVGRFDIKNAYDNEAGQVFFHDARRGLLPGSNPGWVYAPEGVSSESVVRFGLTDLGGGWYQFANVVVDD